MEMKLLDLQTGKYLKIGTEFFYGEKLIVLLTNRKISDSFDKYLIHKSSHTNPIINQLAEKVGAVIYGGRYVLVFEDNNGDIFCEKTKFGTVYYISKDKHRFVPAKDFNHNNDINSTVSRFFTLNKELKNKIANIFEEFAKKEQGLENKFDELYNLINDL